MVAFTIEYYHRRVLGTIEDWPVDLVADYARLVELPWRMAPPSACRTPARWF
jgi:hypothetical protein